MGSSGKIIFQESFKFRDMREVAFSKINMMGRNAAHGDFSGIDFENRDLTDSSFMFATLWRTIFTGAEILTANFSYADGWKSVFTETLIRESNFVGFHGRGASFRGAICKEVNFQNAQFFQADFRGARFIRCNFSGTNIYEARFDEETIFENSEQGFINPEFLPDQVRKRKLRIV